MGTVLTGGQQSEAPAPELRAGSVYRCLVGVGGIGTGLSFALDGNCTLGRCESRSGHMLDVRDYCKLHIICHYVAVLLGADSAGSRFHVLPIAKVGADDAGRRLREELALAGVDVSHVDAVEGRPTLFGLCFQYPDGDGGNIMAGDSAAATLSKPDIDRCEAVLERHGAQAIALAAPEVSLENRFHLLRLAGTHGALRVASFTSSEIGSARQQGMFSHVDILALNQDEAAALAGRPLDPDAPEPLLKRCAEVLRSGQPHIRTVITAGKHGVYAWAGESWDYCPAPSVPTLSTAGAGDALTAGVLSALAVGMPFMKCGGPRVPGSQATALELGVLLASYSVTSPHTIHPGVGLKTLSSFADRVGFGETARYFGYAADCLARVHGAPGGLR